MTAEAWIAVVGIVAMVFMGFVTAVGSFGLYLFRRWMDYVAVQLSALPEILKQLAVVCTRLESMEKRVEELEHK